MTAQIHAFPRPPVTVEVLPLAARFSLRLRAANREAAEAALDLALPDRIGRTASRGERRVLCLGPDEWQLDVPAGGAESVRAALEGHIPHAVVEITDREVTLRIEGPGALDLLSIGISREVGLMEVGRGARTVFDSVQAVLIREAPDRFTLSVWRSFAPHAEELLARGARELALGL